MENPFIDENKKQISFRIKPDLRITINRIADYLAIDSGTYNDTEFISQVFSMVEKKLSKAVKDNPKNIAKIANLESKLENTENKFELALKSVNELQETLIENKKQLTASANLQTDLKNTIEKYQEIITEKDAEIEELEEFKKNNRENVSKIGALSDEIFKLKQFSAEKFDFEFSEIQKNYIVSQLATKKVITWQNTLNANGKLDSLIDSITAEPSDRNISRLVLGYFFYGAKLAKYPLADFNLFLKKQKQKNGEK